MADTHRWSHPGCSRRNLEGVNAALCHAGRGLKGSSSLAQLLAKHRGVRNRGGLPRLEIPLIVQWAKAHREQFGRWPHEKSGGVQMVPGETWKGINTALSKGLRGLPGGTTLYQVLLAYEQMQASEESKREEGKL
jgi:hypothetical protein